MRMMIQVPSVPQGSVFGAGIETTMVKTQTVTKTRKDGLTFQSTEVIVTPITRSLQGDNPELQKSREPNLRYATGTVYHRAVETVAPAPELRQGKPNPELTKKQKQAVRRLFRNGTERANRLLYKCIAQTGQKALREEVLRQLHTVCRYVVFRSLAGARTLSEERSRLAGALEAAEEKVIKGSGSGLRNNLAADLTEEVSERANATLRSRDVSSYQKIGRALSDNLQNVDREDMSELCLSVALAEIAAGNIRWERPLKAEVKRLAYNGIRQYLRRTRYDTHFEEPRTDQAETELYLYTCPQLEYEFLTRSREARIIDLCKLFRQACAQYVDKSRPEGAKPGFQNRKRERLEKVFLLFALEKQEELYSTALAGATLRSRDKELMRLIIAQSPELLVALHVAV